MLKILRAEHILAVFITGIFLLCDIAVLCFFISNFDPTPQITTADVVAEHRIIQTPALSVRTLMGTFPGKTADMNEDVIKQLDDVISAQLKTLSQTKSAP